MKFLEDQIKFIKIWNQLPKSIFSNMYLFIRLYFTFEPSKLNAILEFSN
jgi:hypothetical protein